MRKTVQSESPPQEPEVLLLPEAAAFLRCSDRKLWDLVQAGEVPAARLSVQYRFLRTELREYLQRQTEETKR